MVRRAKSAGKIVGFVPTMGALHAGHLSLIEAAKARSDFVVVSIFVNPAQFGPNEDLQAYPRTPQEDLSACQQQDVDVVFMPSVETMSGPGPLTEVTVRHLSSTLCGRSRPGHFAGVCTVVAKLFNIIEPDKAFFGAKDFQQAVIIRRMTDDLNFSVEIIVCPTVRQADGLAISSRNEYLSREQRGQATALFGALSLAERMIHTSCTPTGEVIEAMQRYLAEHAPEGTVDYIQIVDPNSLRDVETIKGSVCVALAVRIGRVRLIDNILVDSPSAGL